MYTGPRKGQIGLLWQALLLSRASRVSKRREGLSTRYISFHLPLPHPPPFPPFATPALSLASPVRPSGGTPRTWRGWCCARPGQPRSSSTPGPAAWKSAWFAARHNGQLQRGGKPRTWCGWCWHRHSGKKESERLCGAGWKGIHWALLGWGFGEGSYTK